MAGKVLAAGAVLAPPLAVFAPLGTAPLVALLAMALLVADWRQAVPLPRSQQTVGVLLAVLSLWSAATALWSPIPGHSLAEAGRLVLINLAGLVLVGAGTALDAPAAARLGRAAVVGVCVAMILLQLEFWSGKPVWHLLHGGQFERNVPLAVYDRGVTVMLLGSWPAAAALVASRAHRALACGAMAVAATLAQFVSHAALFAGALGLGAMLVAYRLPRLVTLAMVGFGLLIAFAYPAVAPGGAAIAHVEERVPLLWSSAIHRLVIWRFVSDRIAERPLLGWGMDASRAIPGGEKPVSEAMPEVKLAPTATLLPLHPHNAALQWRLELGLPGALLCLGIMALVLWRIAGCAHLAPAQRALALGCAAALLTVALLSFGAWQAWWLSTVWLIAALLAGVQPRPVS